MRKTKEEAEQTRDKILHSAVRLFSEKGVANTSLQEIACDADMTRGAIYWHFKNKAEIFDALHDWIHQPFIDMILQDLEKDHPHPLQQMQDLCCNLLIDLEKNTEKRQAMILFLTKYNYCEPLKHLQEKHIAEKKESQKLFARYFEKAKKKGMLRDDLDPEVLTNAFCCYSKGIILEHFNNPDEFKMSQQVPQLMKLFFSFLK